jgi:hypothetical protein
VLRHGVAAAAACALSVSVWALLAAGTTVRADTPGAGPDGIPPALLELLDRARTAPRDGAAVRAGASAPAPEAAEEAGDAEAGDATADARPPVAVPRADGPAADTRPPGATPSPDAVGAEAAVPEPGLAGEPVGGPPADTRPPGAPPPSAAPAPVPPAADQDQVGASTADTRPPGATPSPDASPAGGPSAPDAGPAGPPPSPDTSPAAGPPSPDTSPAAGPPAPDASPAAAARDDAAADDGRPSVRPPEPVGEPFPFPRDLLADPLCGPLFALLPPLPARPAPTAPAAEFDRTLADRALVVAAYGRVVQACVDYRTAAAAAGPSPFARVRVPEVAALADRPVLDIVAAGGDGDPVSEHGAGAVGLGPWLADTAERTRRIEAYAEAERALASATGAPPAAPAGAAPPRAGSAVDATRPLPPLPGELAAQAVAGAWRLLGVVRGPDGALRASIARPGGRPRSAERGDDLPDGSRVLAVEPRRLVLGLPTGGEAVVELGD